MVYAKGTIYGGNCVGSTEETAYGGESVQRRVQYTWSRVHTHKGAYAEGKTLTVISASATAELLPDVD